MAAARPLGAPTGMNTIAPPVAPVAPQVKAVSGGSQYLRFKRRHQTIFLHCEPQELLGAVKLRLAKILNVDELDLRFYENMSAERKAHVMSILEEKVREAAKLRKKKPGEPKPNIEEEIAAIEIPPLPDEKKLWELGLENDSIVYFVYRTLPNTDLDEWEPCPTNPNPHIVDLPENVRETEYAIAKGLKPESAASATTAAAASSTNENGEEHREGLDANDAQPNDSSSSSTAPMQ